MRRALVALVLSLAALTAFAQSADQEIVSVTDSPDPVTPGNNVTFTVTIRNNGPDPAVNGGVNVSFQQNLTYQFALPPAGWTCTPFGGALTCNTPSLAVGTYTFPIVAQVAASLANFPDGSFTTFFGTSGTTPDANNGNNSTNVTTSWDSPQIDLTMAVSDSPDPVGPNGTITYTANVTQTGPDTATSVNFNTFNNGSLKFQSATIPAGWNCTLPAVNAAPTFTCTRASVPSGTNQTFTVVVLADPAVLGINDGTVSTFFGVNGTGNDTNPNNNGETENTAYVTPDADMAVSVTDSPDPVTPDNDITYTVTVTNNGPDTATSATLNTFNNGTLRFQSAVVPAGWNCTLPAVNAAPTFTCTNPSFANGATSIFTVVARAAFVVLGNSDQTLSTNFNASSGAQDPNNTNNSETENTQYITPDANMQITGSDAPDPVVNGANLTYTLTVTNAGPDAGTNATFAGSPDAHLTFQSITSPAGWNCTTPAVNASGPINCTNASLANGASAQFTLVMKLVASGSGGTLSSTFTTGSSAQDPNNANNSTTILTNWIGQTSDLSITKSTLATAVAQGGTITYTLSTTNNGPTDATAVTVTDTLPAQLLFQSITAPAGWACTTPAAGANGTVSCTIALLTNGTTANFTLVTKVAPNATGSISNSASVGFSGGSDPTPGNSSNSSGAVIVGGNADLSVTKTTAATSVAPNGTLSYTINVTNNGPEAAASVVMTDVLPASLRFQSISAPAGWSCTTPAVGANGTVTCNAATLANGATATFTLTTTVANGATGTIANSASASHSGSDAAAGNNSGASPALPVVATDADLSITKTTGTSSVASGGSLSYTITVTNNGPAAATNVVVTDTLPAGTAFVSATPSQGSCSGTTTVTCTLGTPNASAIATITLNVTVTASSGTIVNTATVNSSTNDPNGANNSGSTPPLPVTPPSTQAEQIPTLSEWALIALAALLIGVAVRRT